MPGPSLRSSACIAALALVLAAGSSSAVGGERAGAQARVASTGLASTFDTGSEGWTAAEAGDPTAWVSVGGHPGGAMSVQRGVNGTTGLRSPASWAGDRRELLGGRLSFDLRLGPGVTSNLFEVGLVPRSGGGDTIYTQVPGLSGEVPAWTGVSLPIRADGSWFKNGAEAGAAEFDSVLADLAYVYVAAFTGASSDTLYLDNVELASKVRRTLTLGLSGARFYGRARPAGACSARQQVTVYRRLPGPDARVGTARTDARGEYAVRARSTPKGLYYAALAATFVEGGGDCSAARSPAVRVR